MYLNLFSSGFPSSPEPPHRPPRRPAIAVSYAQKHRQYPLANGNLSPGGASNTDSANDSYVHAFAV